MSIITHLLYQTMRDVIRVTSGDRFPVQSHTPKHITSPHIVKDLKEKAAAKQHRKRLSREKHLNQP